MTKNEKAKLEKLIERQIRLCNEIKADTRPFEDMSSTEQRAFDQHYGECCGIELALATLGIKFASVDD